MNLKITSTFSLLLFILYTLLLSVSYSKEIAEQFVSSDKDDPSVRNKRDFETLDNLPSESKRQRELIGKRSREFVGKRAREFVGKRFSSMGDYDLDGLYSTLYEKDKRLREFVGKRSEDDVFPEKRLRDFVGKRDFDDDYVMDKRLREFVGKRAIGEQIPELEKRQREVVGLPESEIGNSENLGNFEKRIRELVGKRSIMDKRIRELIGKRLNLDEVYPVYFIRKPKYVRELIGKRSLPSRDDDDYSIQEKRMRDFVGK